MKGKNISKIGMILAAIIIIIYNAGYLIYTKKVPTIAEQKSILLFGGSILVIFSPIYLSIVLDKLGEILNRGSK